MEGEHVVVLSPGQQVVIHYRDDRGHFAAVARVRARTDGVPSVVLAVERVDRLQRREFFRWSGTVDVRYLLVPEDEKVDLAAVRQDPAWKATRTLDLGGGGLCLRLDEPVEVGARVLLAIQLPSQKEPVYAEGRVARVQEVPRPRAARYRAGIEFVRIGESARSKIMGFLFSQQVRFRRL